MLEWAHKDDRLFFLSLRDQCLVRSWRHAEHGQEEVDSGSGSRASEDDLVLSCDAARRRPDDLTRLGHEAR
jgi:hypothetical protein